MGLRYLGRSNQNCTFKAVTLVQFFMKFEALAILSFLQLILLLFI